MARCRRAPRYAIFSAPRAAAEPDPSEPHRRGRARQGNAARRRGREREPLPTVGRGRRTDTSPRGEQNRDRTGEYLTLDVDGHDLGRRHRRPERCGDQLRLVGGHASGSQRRRDGIGLGGAAGQQFRGAHPYRRSRQRTRVSRRAATTSGASSASTRRNRPSSTTRTSKNTERSAASIM